MNVGCELAEGPIWNERESRLLWVDIERGNVWIADLNGGEPFVVRVGRPVGSIAPCRDGSHLAAVPEGLVRMTAGDFSVMEKPDYHLPVVNSLLRMNDGAVDPIGRYVVGTTSRGETRTGAAALWSFDRRRILCLRSDLSISNGIGWTSDGSRMLHIDTPTQSICEFEYCLDTGVVGRLSSTVEIRPQYGAPDGLAIDAEGGVWVALWNGGAVHRYIGGHLDHVVSVPTPLVSSVAFAGPDLESLVITTAVVPGANSRSSLGGALFHCRPGVRGLPQVLCDL